MSQQIREQYLEEDIEKVLLQKQSEGDRVREEGEEYTVAGRPGGYQQRTTGDYDKSLCLIPDDLIDFIKATQPKQWRKLKKLEEDEAEDKLLKRVKNRVDKKGTVFVMRNELKLSACRFKSSYYRPNTGLNPDLQKKTRPISFQ